MSKEMSEAVQNFPQPLVMEKGVLDPCIRVGKQGVKPGNQEIFPQFFSDENGVFHELVKRAGSRIHLIAGRLLRPGYLSEAEKPQIDAILASGNAQVARAFVEEYAPNKAKKDEQPLSVLRLPTLLFKNDEDVDVDALTSYSMDAWPKIMDAYIFALFKFMRHGPYRDESKYIILPEVGSRQNPGNLAELQRWLDQGNSQESCSIDFVADENGRHRIEIANLSIFRALKFKNKTSEKALNGYFGDDKDVIRDLAEDNPHWANKALEVFKCTSLKALKEYFLQHSRSQVLHQIVGREITSKLKPVEIEKMLTAMLVTRAQAETEFFIGGKSNLISMDELKEIWATEYPIQEFFQPGEFHQLHLEVNKQLKAYLQQRVQGWLNLPGSEVVKDALGGTGYQLNEHHLIKIVQNTMKQVSPEIVSQLEPGYFKSIAATITKNIKNKVEAKMLEHYSPAGGTLDILVLEKETLPDPEPNKFGIQRSRFEIKQERAFEKLRRLTKQAYLEQASPSLITRRDFVSELNNAAQYGIRARLVEIKTVVYTGDKFEETITEKNRLTAYLRDMEHYMVVLSQIVPAFRRLMGDLSIKKITDIIRNDRLLQVVKKAEIISLGCQIDQENAAEAGNFKAKTIFENPLIRNESGEVLVAGEKMSRAKAFGRLVRRFKLIKKAAAGQFMLEQIRAKEQKKKENQAIPVEIPQSTDVLY